jgi:hypothetical protein
MRIITARFQLPPPSQKKERKKERKEKTGHEFQVAGCQDKLIGSKLPFIK